MLRGSSTNGRGELNSSLGKRPKRMHSSIGWLAGQFPNLNNLAPLSTGGQKVVVSAEHGMDGPVVLKVFHPGQDVPATQREILAVSRVQSRRVPRIFEHGQITTPMGNCVWLREQRIPGRTVREHLNTSALEPRLALRLGLHILEALVRAEEVNIVHRDVKPENIICDGNEDFWLLDFGIARHLTLQSLTATSDPFGKATLGYAPPEQMRNLKLDIDARSDLFALGITLYESISGRNPFLFPAPANQLELLRRVETNPLPLLTLSFTGGTEFRDLLATMTQKRRDHRPRTAQEAFTWMQEICTQFGL
jgi:serine/threonine protein kinase